MCDTAAEGKWYNYFDTEGECEALLGHESGELTADFPQEPSLCVFAGMCAQIATNC